MRRATAASALRSWAPAPPVSAPLISSDIQATHFHPVQGEADKIPYASLRPGGS